MKLWKSKKPTSCVSGKSGSGKNKYCIQDESSSLASNSNNSNNNNNNNKNVETIPMTPLLTGDRAMSPAQSEDSGLAPDRGPTSAIISLPRESAQAMDIIFADRPDLSYPPVIASVDASGPAADFLSPGDRIHQVDGMSTIGLSNSQIMNLICLGEAPALVEIEYSLPEYNDRFFLLSVSQNSLCVQTKLAQITVERENGCLGLTLRGGGEFPLMITHVRPHGPVFKTGRVKPGDRLLRVDNYSLINKTLSEAQQLLKCGHISGLTNLTIEYDVSVMQSVEYATGPLLIEIERPMNDKLGLVLANYSPVQEHNATDLDEVSIAGIYIASILPASIADRCGALSIGDQILSIDDTILENSEYTPDDAMNLLDANTGLGYTTMQIMPAHALTRKCLSIGSNQKYGLGNGTYSTLESRKSKQRRIQARKSSGSTLTPSVGVCRTETIQVILDCTHGSGLVLGAQTACGRSVIIAQVLEDSVADRSGCIQSGDRIIAVNKMYSLDANTIRQLLGDMGPRPLGYQGTNWVELEIEFDMADSVIPSSGVFNVKLMKSGKGGVGITVNGSSHIGSGGGAVFVITEVKPGSPAHRTGSLRAGDILLAVDSHPLQHFNVDALLKDNSKGCTTLTVKRDSIPDFLFDAQQRSLNPIYGNFNSNPDREIYAYSAKYGEVKYTDCASSLKSLTPQPDYFRTQSNEPQYGNTGADIIDSMEGNSVQNPVVLIRRPYGKFSAMEQPNLGRGFGAENTQSLTTEIADECYNDLSPYELDYPSERFMTLNSNCGKLPPPMEEREYETRQIVTIVRLQPKGGPLGITLAGSEDLNKPITISCIVEGGTADKSGELQIGDCLLAINDESVQGLPLSHATKLLQQNRDEFIDLKLIRTHLGTSDELDNLIDDSEGAMGNSLSQGQAIYAKVQRRPRSPSFTDAISTTSSKDSKHCVLHLTLFKDKVYDDYGFSVSDGLYEKGVFVNRIRSGGPADKCGMLKPFDRIMQVNGTKTTDFDCCLTVPLIASAGDKIDMIVQRPLPD